jgi:putative sterol carrier protein
LIRLFFFSGPQAFMSGKIKLKGNMALAMKLQQVIDAAKK